MNRKELVMTITKDLIVNNIIKSECLGKLDKRTEELGKLFKELSVKISEAYDDLDKDKV